MHSAMPPGITPAATAAAIQNISALAQGSAGSVRVTLRGREQGHGGGGSRMFDMRRRDVIALIGATVAWPVATHAQSAQSPVRIGILPLGASQNAYDRSLVEAFRQGLRQAGLVENRDVVLDVVWITGDPDEAVNELVQRGAEVLVPCGTTASVAARRRTLSIPIVFVSVGNPIGIGLVENLSRPGRNATGFSDILADLGGKYVDLARELSTPEETIDYLWYTGWADGRHRLQVAEQAAQSAGVKLRPRELGEAAEITTAVAAAKASGVRTLIVQPSPFTYRQRDRIIAAAMAHGLATIYAFPTAAREGALIAYGPDYIHMYRRAPFYVDRVLKGVKPAELPVEQPTKIELIVNLKTAKTLGLDVPLSLLIRADELVD
jgi:putative tryptophan/tyrosine transport system substrate-binding protein